MNTALKALGAIAMAGLVGVTGVAPASAAPSAWWLLHHPTHHFVHRTYHPGIHYYSSAPAYHYGPRYYGQRYYYGPGYYYGPSYDPGAAIASGFIGGIFGAIAGTALSHAGVSHVGGGHIWRCEHHYRTYRPSTNSYMGYDGHRHICRL